MKTSKSYIPAAGSDWLLPLYDPLTKLMGGDRTRLELLKQAAIPAHCRVLEIGCGTGTFSILIKQTHPGVEVVGLDPDPRALGRARLKAEDASVSIHFDQGFSNLLPYDSETFDYVFSSMMFHHLTLDGKEKTLREIGRVLKPAGRFEMLDFKKPESALGRIFGVLFHSNDRLKDNSEVRIHALMNEAGLGDSRTVGHGHLLIGSVAYYEAQKR